MPFLAPFLVPSWRPCAWRPSLTTWCLRRQRPPAPLLQRSDPGPRVQRRRPRRGRRATQPLLRVGAETVGRKWLVSTRRLAETLEGHTEGGSGVRGKVRGKRESRRPFLVATTGTAQGPFVKRRQRGMPGHRATMHRCNALHAQPALSPVAASALAASRPPRSSRVELLFSLFPTSRNNKRVGPWWAAALALQCQVQAGGAPCHGRAGRRRAGRRR